MTNGLQTKSKCLVSVFLSSLCTGASIQKDLSPKVPGSDCPLVPVVPRENNHSFIHSFTHQPLQLVDTHLLLMKESHKAW